MAKLENIKKALEELNAKRARSAWSRGVGAYALELLEELENHIDYEIQSGAELEEIPTGAELEKILLNGADSWSAYSWGGSSLIYNENIARRLCTPSELKKTREGERRPNAREDWLDCQARALFQACNRIKSAARMAEGATT